MSAIDNEYTLTVQDVALAFRVTEITVRRWIQNGKLEAIRPDGTRAYRIRATAVQELLGDPVVAQQEESDGTFSSAKTAQRFVVPAKVDEQPPVQ